MPTNCYECDSPLNGPYCPTCNPPRAEVDALIEMHAKTDALERVNMRVRITHLENALREIAVTYDETEQTPTKLCAALYAVSRLAAHALK